MRLGEFISGNTDEPTRAEHRGFSIEARQTESGQWRAYWGIPELSTMNCDSSELAIKYAIAAIDKLRRK